MNFLQLCQRTAEVSGTIAGLPSFSTVTGATGRVLKLVNWVAQAWVDIQNERGDWLFRIDEFEGALSINERFYTGTGFADDFLEMLPDTNRRDSITIYDSTIGQSDEGPLHQLNYETWRARYDRGTHDAVRPGYWAVKYDGSICIGPKPDKTYAIRGVYKKAAQELALDTDTPIIPAEYHTVIVQEALRLMARSDEAWASLIPLSQQYDRTRSALVRAQTPQVFTVGP